MISFFEFFGVEEFLEEFIVKESDSEKRVLFEMKKNLFFNEKKYLIVLFEISYL